MIDLSKSYDFFKPEQCKDRVHIIGCGAIGSHVAEQLVRYGLTKICLSMLEAADYIYMLDNWEDSEGAKIEYSYAVIQGKQVLFEKDESVERINNGFKENNQINRAV